MSPLKPSLYLQMGQEKSHKSVIFKLKTPQDLKADVWLSDTEIVEGSAQIVELAAVIRAFSKFTDPINILCSIS